ncbi:MAG: mechanosensitive ion channel [Candidatus Handelsmanbacteria bacterium]|nr:mechanosensitive ion channel [Candidatus Handelsmanbacteria bacterium]
MKFNHYQQNTLTTLGIWAAISAACFGLDHLNPGLLPLSSGMSVPALLGVMAALLGLAEVCTLFSHFYLGAKKRPPVEGAMVGRVYRLLAVLSVGLAVTYGFGKLAAFGTFFSLFGGMLLGWSLQAPVSGFAAWILISIKRPFRPGDRVQFPNLGLTGDVADTTPMYTYLNQVGGTIGSEEAVGRYILVPNAMLFSQVVINYTVVQESPYMLDEVLVRITFDSNWEAAEKVLLHAAHQVTGDIIQATGVQPYIRSDMYDYGVYLRLRYQTRVKDRAEISYRITKEIFEGVQNLTTVDLAIPFVYSYRRGSAERKEPEPSVAPLPQEVREIEMDRIKSLLQFDAMEEIEAAAKSMSPQWMKQPIVVAPDPEPGRYHIVAGHLQFEVCKHLGWKTMTAVVVDAGKTSGQAKKAEKR